MKVTSTLTFEGEKSFHFASLCDNVFLAKGS
jgi:hypothetical protein